MTTVFDFLANHLSGFALGATLILAGTLLLTRIQRGFFARRSVASLGFVGCAAWCLLVWIPMGVASPAMPEMVVSSSLHEVAEAHARGPEALQDQGPGWAVVLFAWGGLVAFVFTMIGYVRLHWLLRGASIAPPEVGELLASLAGPSSVPRVLRSVRSRQVFSCGLWCPTIVIPQTLCDSSGFVGLRAILGHELAHIRGRDLWRQALAAWLAPVLYWNPLYYLLRRELRFASEVLADDAAAEGTSREEVLSSFLSLAEVTPFAMPFPTTALPALGRPSQFYKRMNLMIHRQKTLQTCPSLTKTLIRGSALLVVLAVTTAAWGAQAEARSHGQKFDVTFEMQDSKSLGPLVADLCRGDLYIHELVFDKKSKWRLRISAAKKGMKVRPVIVRLMGKHKLAVVLTKITPVDPPQKPQKKISSPRIDFAFDKSEVRLIFGAIEKIVGVQISIDPKVRGKVTIRLRNVGWREAMDQIAAKVNAVVSEKGPGVFSVVPRSK